MRKSRTLSLLLAVAVMATMLIAVPLTASAATGDTGYAEWIIYSGAMTSNEKFYHEEKSSPDLGISPTYKCNSSNYQNRNFNVGNTEGFTFSTLSSTEKTFSSGSQVANALKMQSDTTVTIDTKLNDGNSKFNKFDLIIVYDDRYGGGGINISGDNGASGTSVGSSGNADYIYKAEFKDLSDTEIIIKREARESELLYVGISYGYEEKETISVQSVDIKETQAEVYVGGTVKLNAEVLPEEATNKTLTWSAEPSENVTIDSDGTVHGVIAAESVTVTAKSNDDPGKSDTCTVTVKEQPRVTGGVPGSETDLEPAENKTYDLLQAALDAGAVTRFGIYDNNTLYFNKQIAILGSEPMQYRSDKKCKSLTGDTEHSGAVRVSKDVNIIAVKLPAKATIELNVSAWGSGNRNGYIASSRGDCGGSIPSQALAQTDALSTNATISGKLEYKNDTDAAKTVFISGTDELGIYDIKVTLEGSSEPEVFGTTTGTESGYYTEGDVEKPADDTAKGVIRFFQSFEGDTSVEEYGFYFLDSEQGTVVEGYANKASKQGTVNINALPGMYGDLVEIQYDHFGTTYYALPFVKIGGEIVYGTPISGSVGVGAKQVSKPVASD